MVLFLILLDSGLLHPSFIFPYHGAFKLTEKGLFFSGIGFIRIDEIKKVELKFDELYNRFWAGGCIGSFPRLSFFTKGEPLILHLGKSFSFKKLYLLINWSFFTGFTDNEKVYRLITTLKERRK